MKFFKRQELEALELENNKLKAEIQHLKGLIYNLQNDLTFKVFEELRRKKEITKLNKALRRLK